MLCFVTEAGPQEHTAAIAGTWNTLLYAFLGGGGYTLASAAVPALKSFPVFTWAGLPAATAWGWEVAPSAGYIGQGMIMGPRTSLSMLAGAIFGGSLSYYITYSCQGCEDYRYIAESNCVI